MRQLCWTQDVFTNKIRCILIHTPLFCRTVEYELIYSTYQQLNKLMFQLFIVYDVNL